MKLKILFAIVVCAFLSACASDDSNVRHSIPDADSDCMQFIFKGKTEDFKAAGNRCLIHRSENEGSMLMIAAQKGNVELVKYLIEKGANVNSVNITKQSALHLAVLNHHLDIVEILKANGAEIKQNSFGITPLMSAVQLGNFEMVQALEPTFEDINLLADDGWTAIYFAIRRRDKQIFDYILEGGACVNFVDHYSQTPVDFARESGWTYAYDKAKKGKVCTLQ
ncbi:MAG: ankyrin repeat domain-containing protein [Pseudobdellovibrio sp.]